MIVKKIILCLLSFILIFTFGLNRISAQTSNPTICDADIIDTSTESQPLSYVDLSDYSKLVTDFLRGDAEKPLLYPSSNIDGRGVVDLSDYHWLVVYFGQVCLKPTPIASSTPTLIPTATPFVEQTPDVKTQTVPVSQDTYISKNNPSVNYGAESKLKVSRLEANTTNDQRVSYLMFDLTALANRSADCSTCKVKFRIQVPQSLSSERSSYGPYHKAIRIMPYTNWAENSFTYTNARYLNPDTGAQVRFALDYFPYSVVHAFVPKNNHTDTAKQNYYKALVTPVSGTESIVEIDLTSSFQGLLGRKIVLVLESFRDPSSAGFEFYGKEAVAQGKIAPQLVITHDRTPTVNDGFQAVSSFSSQEVSDKNAISLNPLTGLHHWGGVSVADKNQNYLNAVDVYTRFTWNQLETSQGVYDFTPIKNEIAKLKDGQKFSFRVRMMIANGNALPSYLNSKVMSCTGYTNVPDWDDPVLLARARALNVALAAEFDGNPKVGFMDMGFLGRWGEWNEACTDGLSTSVLEEYVKMYTDVFRRSQLVIRDGDEYAYAYARALPPNQKGLTVGTRSDGFGNGTHYSTHGEMYGAYDRFWAFHNSWKTAPVLGEFFGVYDQTYTYGVAQLEAKALHVTTIGNGNTNTWGSLSTQAKKEYTDLGKIMGYKYIPASLEFDRALQKGQPVRIRSTWSNLGNVPTYESWSVRVQLQKGDVIHELPLQNAKLQFLPSTVNQVTGENTPVKFIDEVVVPVNVEPGEYDVKMSVVNPERPNMKLYIKDLLAPNPEDLVSSDGVYSIGKVTIQ